MKEITNGLKLAGTPAELAERIAAILKEYDCINTLAYSELCRTAEIVEFVKNNPDVLITLY